MRAGNSMRRSISCDFFSVSFDGQHGLNFNQVVRELYARCPDAQSRNLEVEDGYSRIDGWQTDGLISFGAMLRLRTNSPASIARLDVDGLQELQLSPGDVLTEYFCFRYFEEFQTLVVHRNRDAGSISRLLYYMKERGRCNSINFEPILTRDAWRRLDQMQEISLAEIKLAVPNNLDVLDNGNRSVSAMIALGREVRAATITVQVSIGHSRRPLLQRVKEVWRHLVDEYGDVTQSATVRGRIPGVDGDDISTVDLLTERMREKISITIIGNSPSLSEYQHALQTAYDRRREAIREQFGTNH